MAIREAIAAALKGDPLDGVDGWLESFAAVPKERLTRTGSSNRFMAYETDFGWGKPSRVELVLLSGGELVLLLGAREEGAVQRTQTCLPSSPSSTPCWLQSSLAAVLSIFIPLSGKLLPECRLPRRQCKFVKAEFSSTINNMRWLAVGGADMAQAGAGCQAPAGPDARRAGHATGTPWLS
ncbi:hypothetical protein PR202_gb17915 [Eleusine coracana subsp. coracana]|uniref:Anthocyanin 5-aromatic acyltransferase n=1 Tax=Eleusine coracana subsp. coracana TaxID=191504 RepID=A0AAV5F4A9_ELECO|nr:hypothetical protein PR202_gb17915 [Eleusine coracana subsp. coracana]